MKQITQNLLGCLLLASIAFIMSCGDDDSPTPVPDPDPNPCEGVTADPNTIYDFDCQRNADISEIEALTIVANPNKSGINVSDSVGRFVDNGGDAWDNLIIDFGSPIDLSTNGELVFQLHADRVVPVLAKLEGGTAIEVPTTVKGVGQWFEYKFDFSSAAGEGNTTMVLFFNAGQTDGNAEDVYYVDNIKWREPTGPDCEGVTKDPTIINDFECQNNSGFVGNNVAESSVVVNPDKSGINVSDSVGLFMDDGSNQWDALVLDFGEPFDLTTNSVIALDIYSTKSVPFIIKIEGGSPTLEFSTTITELDTWVEYRFDFSAAAGNNNDDFVLIFDYETPTGGNYYFDNIRLEAPKDACDGIMKMENIISDFECQQNRDFGDTNISTDINPSKTGVNLSDSVGRFVDNGGDAWDNIIIDYGEPIDLSTNNILKLKIYSSKTVPLLTKLEGGTSPAVEIGNCCENGNNIDVVNEWKEYSFDYSDQAGEVHNKLVLFFNAGNTDGSVEDIYYVDDIRFEDDE